MTRLLVLLALLSAPGALLARTHGEAQAECASYVATFKAGYCYPDWIQQDAWCETEVWGPDSGTVKALGWGCGGPAVPGVQAVWPFTGPANTCEAGRTGTAEFGYSGGDVPSQICLEGCQADFDMDMCGSGGDNGGWCIGTYEQTGETCDGDIDPPDECVQLGQGFSICQGDPPGCMRTPSGMLCPDFDTPDCADNGQHVVCSGGEDIPDGFSPGPEGESCSDWSCTPLQGGSSDQDGDGDPDADDDDDDNDGVDDEEDDNEDEITANLPGCGDGEPTCSDPDNVECRHYVISWRHRCDGHSNKAGGGATCNSPPTCSHHDPVQCAQLTQLWRIRCDHDGKITGGLDCTSQVTCAGIDPASCHAAKQLQQIRCGINPVITGGNDCDAPFQCNPQTATCRQLMLQREAMCSTKEGNEKLDTLGGKLDGALGQGGSSDDCNTPPTCSAGAGIGCALLRQQWRNYCATKEVKDALAEGGGGTTPENITNAFAPVGEDAITPAGDGDGVLYEPEEEDEIEWGGGWEPRGTCPVSITFSSARLGGFVVPNHYACTFLDALAQLVLLAGALTATWIAFGMRK